MALFRFSTDAFPEHDRIAAWREIFGQKIAKLDMEPPKDEPFRGEVTVKTLPNLSIGLTSSTPNRIARTPHLIADGSEDVMLGIVLTGEAIVTQAGQGEVKVGPGEAVVWSNSSIGQSYYTAPIEFLSVAVPRNILVPSLVHPDSLTLSVIPPQSEALRLLTGYAQVLLQENVSQDLAALSAAHIHDLVAMALGPKREADQAASRRGVRAARLRAIKADIQTNLSHRDLTVDAIALRHGISPRSIRELFADEGTTFTDYVLNQRLTRAHRLLTDPRFAGSTISAIAFDSGFGDLSYFNHAFRRRYNATPSDVRAAALRREN